MIVWLVLAAMLTCPVLPPDWTPVRTDKSPSGAVLAEHFWLETGVPEELIGRRQIWLRDVNRQQEPRLLFEHQLRSLFANPTAAAVFLMVNGLILFAAERLRRRAPGAPERAEQLERGDETDTGPEAEQRLATLGYREAVAVGSAQAAALFPGISRSGVTMGGGLFVGLTHEDAARYAFLLATPIIGAAALLKLPDLFGSDGNGVRGPALAGALCAGLAAWASVKFLMRYFETNSLTPFAWYCLLAGLAAFLVFVL